MAKISDGTYPAASSIVPTGLMYLYDPTDADHPDKTIDIETLLDMGVNAGVAATGVVATESYGGGGFLHRTKLVVSTTLPAIAGGADLAVGKLLYTFPAGVIVVDSSYMSLAITQSQGHITSDTPDGGLGTVIGAGIVNVLGGTAGFENILTGQTFANCSGTAKVKTVGTQLVIEAADAHTVYFNAADGWAASGDAAAALAGTVVLNWRFLI